jgi:tetratricopeptide (TPR) repeat protein
MFLRDQGRMDEAVPQLRAAAQLAPVSELTSLNFAYALMDNGLNAQAMEQAELAAQLNPNGVATQLLLASIYHCAGREDDRRAALARAEAAAADNPHALAALVGIYNRAGLPDKSLLLRRRLEELARQRYVSPFDLANASLVFGEEERALALFEEAYKQRSAGLIFLRGRNFANMRQREQFERLVNRMRFAG